MREIMLKDVLTGADRLADGGGSSSAKSELGLKVTL
jgi:hypothetical protein